MTRYEKEIPLYRTFNGKRFRAYGFSHTKKSVADKEAKSLKNDGYNVRTVRYGKKYINYAIYSKKRIKEANIERKRYGLPKYKR